VQSSPPWLIVVEDRQLLGRGFGAWSRPAVFFLLRSIAALPRLPLLRLLRLMRMMRMMLRHRRRRRRRRRWLVVVALCCFPGPLGGTMACCRALVPLCHAPGGGRALVTQLCSGGWGLAATTTTTATATTATTSIAGKQTKAVGGLGVLLSSHAIIGTNFGVLLSSYAVIGTNLGAAVALALALVDG
jgi:hypothetical protein